MKTRILSGLVVGLLLFGTVLGSAAALTVTPEGVAAVANQTVAACDSDGVDLAFDPDVLDPLSLATVDVTDIAAGCLGMTVHVTIAGTTVSATISGTTVDNLDFSAAGINIADVTAVSVVIA